MSVKENIENKIMSSLEDALDIISIWRNNKEKIVFTELPEGLLEVYLEDDAN